MSEFNIVAFINPKSGGLMGQKVFKKLQSILGSEYVFDLTNKNPVEFLKKFSQVQELKVMACGGDGTIGWVLSIIDDVDFVKPPSVLPLPLGTGNDMSRILRWGSNYMGQSLVKLMGQIKLGLPIQLDRWDVVSRSLKEDEVYSLLKLIPTDKNADENNKKASSGKIFQRLSSSSFLVEKNMYNPNLADDVSNRLSLSGSRIGRRKSLDDAADVVDQDGTSSLDEKNSVNLHESDDTESSVCKFSNRDPDTIVKKFKQDILNHLKVFEDELHSVNCKVLNLEHIVCNLEKSLSLLDKNLNNISVKNLALPNNTQDDTSFNSTLEMTQSLTKDDNMATRTPSSLTQKPSLTRDNFSKLVNLVDERVCHNTVMNNYFSFGIDSKIALEFHNSRETNPKLFTHHLINKVWYGYFGLKHGLKNFLNKPLNKICIIELDGKIVKLPKQLQAIVFLQIPSYSSGTDVWGSPTYIKNQVSPPQVGDGLFEVIGLKGLLHLSYLQVGWSSGTRIGQASKAVIYNLINVPAQCDGEPFILPPSRTKITLRKKSTFLFNLIRGGFKNLALVTGIDFSNKSAEQCDTQSSENNDSRRLLKRRSYSSNVCQTPKT